MGTTNELLLRGADTQLQTRIQIQNKYRCLLVQLPFGNAFGCNWSTHECRPAHMCECQPLGPMKDTLMSVFCPESVRGEASCWSAHAENRVARESK